MKDQTRYQLVSGIQEVTGTVSRTTPLFELALSPLLVSLSMLGLRFPILQVHRVSAMHGYIQGEAAPRTLKLVRAAVEALELHGNPNREPQGSCDGQFVIRWTLGRREAN
jgi:hypothetical protein